jgi:two-component system cell cycle sensor histidine kinase/response regulator CckA
MHKVYFVGTSMVEKTKSLLVVDDDPYILRVIDLVFASSEFQILQAKDGVAALKRIDASGAAIDVLLVDVMMPRLNGAELARVVLGCHPTIKIIFMSGYPDDIIDRWGIFSSKIRYIKKPFTPDSLIRTVREELAK